MIHREKILTRGRDSRVWVMLGIVVVFIVAWVFWIPPLAAIAFLSFFAMLSYWARSVRAEM